MIPSKIALNLIRKFKTNNPFELSDYTGITVIKCPLGNIKGCYKFIKRTRVIFINSDLEYHEQKVVCAHELGHALMHPKVNCSFIQNFTLLSVNKLEIEANKFAAELLINEIGNVFIEDMSINQLASYYGLPEELIRYKYE